MSAIEVIVIDLVAYASLLVVIGIAVYMAALAMADWRRHRHEDRSR
jgi:hypothetical protein